MYFFKFLKSAILSLAAAVSTQAVSESAADLVSTIQHPNFQHIYLITDPDARSFEARLIFQAGELDNPYTEGLAHYVEHLAWLNVTQSQNFQALRHSNAGTNLTSTTYVTHSSETRLNKELQRLVEVSAPFTLAKSFMLEERDINLREYEANVAENPYFEIEQNITKALYPSSPWARSVLGSPTEIEDFSLINAKKLHRKSHELGNAVLIVTGNISKTTLQKALRNLNFPKAAAPIAPTPLPTPEVANKRVAADIHVARLGNPTLFYRKLIKRPPCSDAAFCDQTVRVLRAALDSSLPGGIAGPLRFDDFFARSFWFDLRAIGSKHLLIEFTAEPDLNISLSKLETEFTKVFNEIVQQGIPEKTIKQIKKRFQGHLNDVLKRENYRKNFLIDRVSNRQPYYGLTAERRALRSVTAQKINDLLTALGQSGRTVIYRANAL